MKCIHIDSLLEMYNYHILMVTKVVRHTCVCYGKKRKELKNPLCDKMRYFYSIYNFMFM